MKIEEAIKIRIIYFMKKNNINLKDFFDDPMFLDVEDIAEDLKN